MRKFLIAAFAAGMVFSTAALKAEDKKDDKKKKEGVNGILVDAKCGKDKKADDVKGHPAACALKCADAGLGVMKGDKWIKFDDEGQKLAKEYLEKVEAKENKDKKDDDKEKMTTKVHVEGKVSEDGKTIAVKSIHAAGGKKEKEKDDKHEHDDKEEKKS